MLKSFPSYYRSQQRGVVTLLILIVIIQIAYYLLDFSNGELTTTDAPEILAFQAEIDSLKQIEAERLKPKIYPFNPSFLTDHKGYQLGMSSAEIDRLLTHRKAGKYINSAREFQQVTQISDSLLTQLKPYFKFPDWVIAKNKKKELLKKTELPPDEPVAAAKIPKKDLNEVSLEDLIKIKGIGNKLGSRIINYRKKLKGYSMNEQLYEVWYLDKEVADRVLQSYPVLSKPQIQKLNINTAQFKEVLHLPYMDYELTKKIFSYRDEMAEIQSIEELKKIEGFPVEKFDRIRLYLTAE